MATRLEADLERLSLADLSPDVALVILRQLRLESPATFPERAYTALGSAVLRLLGSRRDDQLREWTDVIRQVSAIIRNGGDAATADRLQALSDLTATRSRMSLANPVHEVLGRPHCWAVLDELRHRGGNATRDEMEVEVAISKGNLLRVVDTLESAGLVRRGNDGSVALTLEGDRALDEIPAPTP